MEINEAPDLNPTFAWFQSFKLDRLMTTEFFWEKFRKAFGIPRSNSEMEFIP